MHTESGAHSLELKVPPVVVVIIAAFLMRLGAVYVPGLNFRFPFRSVVGWVVALMGIIGCALGFVEFRRAKTTVNPTKPESSSSLLKTGIYRRTRNPMYLGFLLMLAGWAVLMGNALSFLALPVFVFYMNRFQIKPEERALRSIFGDEFAAYRSDVRRWI